MSEISFVTVFLQLDISPIDLDSHVNRQLNAFSTGKDDIIRQHKKNRLRIMCLLMTSSYLWVGTSAGVVLNIGNLIYGDDFLYFKNFTLDDQQRTTASN